MQKKKAKTGTVRLYLETRYDIPFSCTEPVTTREAVKIAMDSIDCNLYGLVETKKGEYAETVHAVLVDLDVPGGECPVESELFESPEDIEEIVYNIPQDKELRA